MSMSARSVRLLERVRSRTEAASAAEPDSEPVGSILDIIMIGLEIFQKFAPILENCRNPVPPTPPVPDALVAVGVTAETWHQAFVSKYGAMQSVKDDGFLPVAIRRTAAEIRKSKRIKKKAAIPLAISALQTGRDETVEDMAIAAQQVKDNKAAFAA